MEALQEEILNGRPRLKHGGGLPLCVDCKNPSFSIIHNRVLVMHEKTGTRSILAYVMRIDVLYV